MDENRDGLIIAFGDSLSEGYMVSTDEAYPALLEKRLRTDGHPFTVVNEGISGETSSGALSRVDHILSYTPDIVILETGANDAFMGIPPGRTRQNMETILRLLSENGIIPVIGGMQIVFDMDRAYTAAFERIYPELAEQFGAILFPFFLEGVLSDSHLNFGDGIHPNAAGYRIVAKNIYPFVIQAIDRLSLWKNAGFELSDE